MANNLSESEELELLQLQKTKAMAMQGQQGQGPEPTFSNVAQLVPKMAGIAATDVVNKAAPMLPAILGGAALGPAGAAAGAGVMAIGKRMLGIASGKEAPPPMSDPNATFFPSSPKTMLAEGLPVAGQSALAGLAQEPKLLADVPGIPKVAEMLSGAASKTMKGLARLGQTLSGAKADVLTQAAKKGVSTYGAESMPKAQAIFADALGPEGRKAMEQTAEEAFDSALSKARSTATEIGTKIENGESVSAIDALKARQATDRIISSTPVTDKVARNALYKWRNLFDNELASQSGKLANASRGYRQSIVKDTILNPTRLNKSGEPSAFLPMLVGHGMIGKGVEGGLGMLTATSPAAWGLGATVGGSTARGLQKLGDNPAIRQALLGILQQITQKRQQ